MGGSNGRTVVALTPGGASPAPTMRRAGGARKDNAETLRGAEVRGEAPGSDRRSWKGVFARIGVRGRDLFTYS
jgi:hypothetical protein